jgi:hypothetical protein
MEKLKGEFAKLIAEQQKQWMAQFQVPIFGDHSLQILK